MALQSTGPISMTQIKAEAYLGEATIPTAVNLGSVKLRSLAKVTTVNSMIKFSDFYGKSKYTFQNGDFSVGTLAPNPSETNSFVVPGWVIYLTPVRLNGNSTVAGKPTPTDDKADEIAGSGSYNVSLSTDLPSGMTTPSRSLNLYNTGTVSGFGIAHGPYAVSEDPIALETGDQVSIWWKAAAAGDAFDINAYLVNINNGNYIPLANATGDSPSATQPWTKVTLTISAAQASPDANIPDYKFVFISGSYDATGGTVTGANLYVTMIDVKKWFQI